MSEKVMLNEEELGDVQAGYMKFCGGNNVLVYTQKDGSKKRYTINGNVWDAYKRNLALRIDHLDQEDYILEVLQKEGYVGQEIK